MTMSERCPATDISNPSKNAAYAARASAHTLNDGRPMFGASGLAQADASVALVPLKGGHQSLALMLWHLPEQGIGSNSHLSSEDRRRTPGFNAATGNRAFSPVPDCIFVNRSTGKTLGEMRKAGLPELIGTIALLRS